MDGVCPCFTGVSQLACVVWLGKIMVNAQLITWNEKESGLR